MKKVNFLNNNTKKIKYLLVLGGILLFMFVFFPTFGRYKNRTSFYDISEWDGSVASSYRSGSGSEIDPYVISNGSEFAYFASQLKYTDYANVYFELSNDIVLNKGIFDYDGTISYSINDGIYQITEYTNDYDGGSVNEFSPIKEFNGHLNGNSYRIYGLYITSESDDNLALFESIGGSISNLYISNSMIYGGYNTSMLSVNSSNASISNVMIDGFVIGNSSNKISEYDLDDISSGSSIDLSGYDYEGDFIFSTLSGKFTPSDELNTLTINNQVITSGDFSVTLSDVDSVEYSLSLESEYTITNLKYSVESDYGVASSFILNSSNTNYSNVVNKSYVYGKKYSSGFIYKTTGSMNFSNSYNIGKIVSDNYSSGFISFVDSGEVTINNVYNNGNISSLNNSLFINNVLNGNVSINNSFVTSSDYIFNEISGSVSINNVYSVSENIVKTGSVSGNVLIKSTDELMSEEFILNTLLFKEFVSLDDLDVNADNIWVLEKDGYPILYIDDLNRPAANIYVSLYSWNTLAYDLDTHKFSDGFMFNIETTDVLANVKSIEYYLHESTSSLTLDEINEISDFKTYSEVVSISDEGSYIIYAKITDGDDNVTYINSDILIIDYAQTIASVSLGDYKWDSLTSVPGNIYLDDEKSVVVNVNSDYVDINEVKYYLTSDILKEEELDLLSDVWLGYNDGVSITSSDNNIVYFKITDKNGYVTYISTDYITLDGYTMKDIMVGRDISDNNVSITDKSSISFTYTYTDSNLFVDGYTHNLISNILLPENTHITLIDNINNKVYKYKTDSSSYGYDDVNKRATYSLSKFNEIGTLETMLFNDSVYLGEINEDFKVIIDFKDTSFESNYNDVSIYLQVNDKDGNKVISTLKNSIKTFNIYSGVESNLSINSNFNGYIDYNRDNSNSVDFDIKLNHYLDGESIVYDSISQDKRYGLEIKMVDNDTNSVMGKSYLSNIQFKYNDKVYMPYSSGIVNIDLGSQISGNLIIDTYVNHTKIEGNYSFYICPYSSYDGVNYSTISLSKCINVPLNILDNYSVDYNFDIVINSEDRLFLKNSDKTLNFELLYQSDLDDVNVRVSLYEKNQLTAYDQSYSLVDLNEYLYNKLELVSNNVYYLNDNVTSSSEYVNYSLSFDNSMFNMNGYKLVFDLYSSDKKIGSIEKKFVVKGDE